MHEPHVPRPCERFRAPRRRGARALALAAAGLLLIQGAAAAAAETAALPAGGAGASQRAVEAAYEFVVAKILVDASEYEDALAAFEHSIELDGSDPYAYLELAKFHTYLSQISRSAETRARHLEEAVAAMETALAKDPENLDVLRSYGQVEMRLGEHRLEALDKAQSAFETLRGKTSGDLQVLSSLGQIYLWKNQPEKAAEVLREAASYLPNQRGIQAMLAEALLGSNQLEEAEKTLVKLISLAPDSVDYRLRLADLRSQRGDHAGAVAALSDTPPELADDARLRHTLARELHLTGHNDEALETLDGLIDEIPDNAGLHRLRIAILTAMARYEDAIAEVEPLLSDPGNARKRQDTMLLSRLLERVGRADEAAERLRDLRDTIPDSERMQLELGLAGVLERAGRVDEAAEVLRALLASVHDAEDVGIAGPALAEVYERANRGGEALAALDETLSRLTALGATEAADGLRLRRIATLLAHHDDQAAADAAQTLAAGATGDLRLSAALLRADALAGLGDVEGALALIPLDPGSSEIGARRKLAKRVEILFDHDRDTEARELIDGLLASGDPEDVLFAARIYQVSSRYADLLPLVERYLAAEPDSQPALFLLGSALEQLGRHAESAAAFEKLLALEPDHAAALNYLGYMWAEQGENLDQALDLVLRAVALDPDNGAYVDSLGWVYYRLGRYQEARSHLEWAARLIPADATIREHLGDLYLRLEEVERARDAYRQAVDLSGANADEVRRKLESLDQKGL